MNELFLAQYSFSRTPHPPPPSTSPGMLLDQDHYPTFSIFYGVDRLAIDCFLLMFFHSFRRVVTFWLFWCFNLFGFFRFAVASVVMQTTGQIPREYRDRAQGLMGRK